MSKKKTKPTEKKYDTRPKRVKTTKRWSTRSRQRSLSKHDEKADEDADEDADEE